MHIYIYVYVYTESLYIGVEVYLYIYIYVYIYIVDLIPYPVRMPEGPTAVKYHTLFCGRESYFSPEDAVGVF